MSDNEPQSEPLDLAVQELVDTHERLGEAINTLLETLSAAPPAEGKRPVGLSSRTRAFHLNKRSPEVVALYERIESFCMSLAPETRQNFRNVYTGYFYRESYTFARVTVPRKLQEVRLWVRLPPEVVRDLVSKGIAESALVEGEFTKVKIGTSTGWGQVERLIRRSFDALKHELDIAAGHAEE